MKSQTILASILILSCAAALARPQAQPPQDPAPIDARGYQQLIASYRGKPLLVAFWATWCEPCRDEFPMLNDLAKEYGPKGLKVVGISLDDDGEMILVRRFLARYQPVFPNYRKTPGKQEEFVKAVDPQWNGSIPASFFYARDARQVRQFVGTPSREQYEAAIRALLSVGADANRCDGIGKNH